MCMADASVCCLPVYSGAVRVAAPSGKSCLSSGGTSRCGASSTDGWMAWHGTPLCHRLPGRLCCCCRPGPPKAVRQHLLAVCSSCSLRPAAIGCRHHMCAKRCKPRAAAPSRDWRLQVPYIEDPNTGKAMFESAAICEYLEVRGLPRERATAGCAVVRTVPGRPVGHGWMAKAAAWEQMCRLPNCCGIAITDDRRLSQNNDMYASGAIWLLPAGCLSRHVPHVSTAGDLWRGRAVSAAHQPRQTGPQQQVAAAHLAQSIVLCTRLVDTQRFCP